MHTWSSLMWLSPFMFRLTHPELAFEPGYYRKRMAGISGMMIHPIMQYCAQLHLQAGTYYVQNGTATTQNVKLLEFYMGWKNSMPTTLWGKFASSLITHTIGGNTEQRWGDPITVVTRYSAKNTWVQSVNDIEVWSRLLHCGLAVLQEPHRKQDKGISGMMVKVNTVITSVKI